MSVRGSPSMAAALSFLLPGLGQLSLGRVRRGVVVAVPAVVVFAIAMILAATGPSAVVDVIVRPEVLIALLVLNLVLAAYHVVAIVDAWRLARRRQVRARRPARRAATVVLAVALTATLGVHGVVGVVGYELQDTLNSVLAPPDPDDGWAIPEPSFEPEPSSPSTPLTIPSASGSPTASAPSGPTATPSPSPTPTASPAATPKWARDGRLNVLLIGSDAGPDRWSLRTDTIVVLSIDLDSHRAALFGIPRNMVGVPLPPESAGAFAGGRFPGLLNALYVYAMGHPGSFPGGDARGFRAVTGAVQELVGVRLDFAVVVNLAGFVRLIDAIGGLWIEVPERLTDAFYPLEDGSGHIRLDIKPGCQLLDGRTALAYARSRHQDSDYGRMRRQQQVLVALARQVDPVALIPRVPDLLSIAKGHLWTTIPRSAIGPLARLAAEVDVSHVRTVLFVPSRYPSHLDSAEIARIRSVVRTIFDRAPSTSTPKPPSGATCPR